MLRKLFRPKWRHPDPGVRRGAVASLDPEAGSGEVVLEELARSDSDAQVRGLAAARLCSLEVLMQVLSDDPDPGVRQRALDRFRQCLCGDTAPTLDLQTRLDALGRCAWPDLLADAALRGKEPELRLSALARVEDETVCAQLAVQDSVPQVRRAALDRLSDPQLLDQVAKAARHRDKRISRLARERLQTFQAAARRAARHEAERETICRDLEQVLQVWELRRVEAALSELNGRWDSVEGAPSPELAERFADARACSLEHLARLRAAAPEEASAEDLRAQRIALCESVEGLLGDLENAERLDPETERQVLAALEVIERSWAEFPSTADPEEQQFQAHFAQAREAVRARLEALRQTGQLHQTLSGLLRDAQVLAASTQPLEEAEVQDLAHRHRALGSVPPGVEALGQRFVQAMQDLKERLRLEREARTRSLAELAHQMDRLEQALDAGELALARDLAGELEARLPAAAPDQRLRTLAARLQKASARAQELDGWRRWADTLEREKLCDDIEALIGVSEDPRELAARIQELRAAWGALGPPASGKDHALSRRFNRACEQAYAPCRAYFRAQAEERSANLAARQEVCGCIEQYLASTDWDGSVDWAGVEQLAREVRQVWKTLGPAPRRDARSIQERFEAAMTALQQRLARERQRNSQSKLQIVQEAEAQGEQTGARDAVQRIQALRKRWQAVGYAAPAEERDLRRRFEAACRKVFEERRQHAESARRELLANQERRAALCQQLDAMAALDGAELQAAARQLPHLEQEWTSLGPAPKEIRAELERRFREGIGRLRQRRADHEARLHQEQVDLLVRKAALCSELESLAGCSDERARERLAGTQAEWSALPALAEPTLEAALAGRFARAAEGVSEAPPLAADLEREREATLRSKEILCIRMEILAGVDSPPEASEDRLSYQVSRLAEGFGSHTESRDPAAVCWELEQAWYSTGPLPPGTAEALEARFQRARQVLQQDRLDAPPTPP